MSVITAISAAPRRAGRFEIIIDGDACAILSVEEIERLNLSVGRDVTGLEDIIVREGAIVSAFDRALNMLAARARSSAELCRLLVRKGEEQSIAELVVARLQQRGLVDDAAFAMAFVRSKVVVARHSKRRVQMELARKGVAREVSDAAIRHVFEDEGVDQAELVEAVARKKLRTLGGVEPAVRRRRVYAFLARRGYDGDDIRRAMEAVGEEMRDS